MVNLSGRWKNFLYFGLSTAIILALIYFADAQKFIESVNSAQTVPLAIGVLFGIFTFSVFGFTWHRFLQKIGVEDSYLNSLRLFMAGQFMNSITPLGQAGGEPVMAYIVKDNQETTYEKALSAVVSADIVNSIPDITFLLAGTFYLLVFDSVNRTIAQTSSMVALITVIGGIGVYMLWFRAATLERVFSRILNYSHRLTGFEILLSLDEKLEDVRESFDTIGEDPGHLAVTALVAHLSFASQVAALFFVLDSVGQTVGLTSIYFIIAISSLANFTPTPGGSGTYEAAMAGVLTVFMSISFAEALTVAILYRVATYWDGLILGYISILSLRKGSGINRARIERNIADLR